MEKTNKLFIFFVFFIGLFGLVSAGTIDVTLNSPADDSTVYIPDVNFNGTVSTDSGYFINVSLWTNESGSWEEYNVTNFVDFDLNLETMNEFSQATTKKGIKFIISTSEVVLNSVDISSLTDATHWYLGTTNGGSEIASGLVGGLDTITIDETLPIGTYYLTANRNGVTYDQYKHTTPSYPYTYEYLSVVSDSDEGTGDIWIFESLNYGISESSKTQTFNRTLTGDIVWNVKACDSEGDCEFATSNYTVTLDSSAPTITPLYPVGTLNYGKLGENINLNVSVSDDNLDSCWYNYNGTNVTYTCNTNTTFTLGTAKSLMYYANDTTGTLESENITWDYKIFENSNVFNNEIISGTLEDFLLNITLLGGVSLSSVTLNYGENTISPSITQEGDYIIISKVSYQVPIYTTDTNVTFYYSLELDDETEINSTTNTQLIEAINLDDCSSYTYNLLNLALYDEQKKSSLSGLMEVDFELLNFNYELMNAFNISFEDVSTAQICSDTNLSNQGFFKNVEIRYKGNETNSSYNAELYNIQRAEIGLNPSNISLYNLNASSSTQFKITYQDSTYNFVEGAIIQLQRKYISEGIYHTVEAPITSSDGVAILHIDLDSIKYKITIVKNGIVLDTFDNLVFKCNSELTGECEQKLLGKIDPNNQIDWETFVDFSYSEPFMDNDSITVSFSIPSGSQSSINLVLEQKDSFGNKTLCNRTIVSSAGSISCEYSETLGQSYIDLSIYKDGLPLVFKSYVVDSNRSLDWLGNNYIFIFVIMLSLVGMSLSSPEWIVINGVVTMVIAGGLYLAGGLSFVAGLGGIVWLVVSAIILINKLSQQEDR